MSIFFSWQRIVGSYFWKCSSLTWLKENPIRFYCLMTWKFPENSRKTEEKITFYFWHRREFMYQCFLTKIVANSYSKWVSKLFFWTVQKDSKWAHQFFIFCICVCFTTRGKSLTVFLSTRWLHPLNIENRIFLLLQTKW